MENLGIVIEIRPELSGLDRTDARVAQSERRAKQAADAISRALAGGLTGSSAGRAQATAASKAAREQERAARDAGRAQAREAKAAGSAQAQAAREAAAAQMKSARDAEREQIRAAKNAAREQTKAARDYQASLQRAEKATAGLSRRPPRSRKIDGAGYLPDTAGPSAGGAASSLAGRALPALAAAVSVREIAGLADAYTTLGNRLSTVTKNEAELAHVRGELFNISNRTRTSIEASAQLYSTFGKGILDTGRSHDQVLPIIESVQQAIKLSGSSAASAEAALVQLGQGMSAGALRGEELNSILEQAPKIADIIAKQLGVTRGELRKLGEQGKLTSEVIISAFQSQRAEIAGAFAKTVPTIAEQFVVFKNEVTKLVGEFNKNGQAGAVLGKVFKELLSVVKSIGAGIKLVVGVFSDLNDLVGGRLVSAIEAFASKIKYTIPILGQFLLLKDLIQGGEEIDTAAQTAAMDTVASNLPREEIGPGTSQSQDVDRGKALNDLDALSRRMLALGTKLQRSARRSSGLAALESEENKAAAAAAESAKRLREEYARFADSVNPVGAALREIAEAEALVGKAQAANVPGAERALEHLARKRDLLRDQIDPFTAVTHALEREIALLGVSDDVRGRTTRLLEIENDLRGKGVALTDEQWASLDRLLKAESAATEAAAKKNEAYERQNTILDGIYQKQDTYNTGLGDLKTLLDEGYLSTQQYAEQVANLQSAFGELAKTPLDDYWAKALPSEAVIAAAETIRSRFADVFHDLGSGLQELALAGKGSFEALANDALLAIQRILIKMLALKAVEAIFGGNSDAFSFVGQVLGVTSGGNRAAGGSFLVGGHGGTDSQPVAFRATPGERVTVSRPETGGSGAPPNVSVPIRVINVTDPKAALDVMAGAEGERVILNVIDRRASAIKSRLDQG